MTNYTLIGSEVIGVQRQEALRDRPFRSATTRTQVYSTLVLKHMYSPPPTHKQTDYPDLSFKQEIVGIGKYRRIMEPKENFPEPWMEIPRDSW